MKRVEAEEIKRQEKYIEQDQQEALDMIFHKIGRIVAGDPNYADSWHNITRYTTLIEKRLEGSG